MKVTTNPLLFISIKSEPHVGPVGPSVTDVLVESVKIARERATRGPKAGGKAQFDRAAPEHEKLREAYRAYCADHPPKRGRKSAFIRSWRGPPYLEERQMFHVLSAEP